MRKKGDEGKTECQKKQKKREDAKDVKRNKTMSVNG
jgi:hypothetical protein